MLASGAQISYASEEDWNIEVAGCPSLHTSSATQNEQSCNFDGQLYALGNAAENVGPWAAILNPPPLRSQVEAHVTLLLPRKPTFMWGNIE